MRLLSKLTSLERVVVQTTMTARVLLPVLFLLAPVSCSVSKQLWIQNAAQQSDINGKTSPAIPSNGVRNKSLPDLTSLPAATVQSSDILGLFLTGSTSQQALTVSPEGEVYLWNLKNQQPYTLTSLEYGPFDVVAFNAAELLLATARENDVRIFSIVDGTEVAKLRKLKTRAASLAFQPSGRSLVIGGADGEVYRWRFVEEKAATTPAEIEKTFERYFGHANVISSVMYHPIGRVFFSGDWSGALNAWLPYDADAFGGEYLQNAFGPNMFSDRATRVRAGRVATASIEHIRVSQDGEALIAGGQDGVLEWWQVRGFTIAATTPAHRGLLYDIALAPSGKVAATLGRDGKIRTWQLTKTVNIESAKTTFSIDKLKEIEATGGRKLLFLDETTLLLGDRTGRISLVRL